MAYINFKEEKSVAIKELQKRRNNNENISIKVTSNNSKIDLDKWEKYSFKTISDRTINSSHVEGEDNFLEIREKNIVCSHIIRCKFYNIKFIQCNFIGCIFEECDFGGGGVVFENCTFIQEQIKKSPSLNKKDNFSCDFIRCKIYGKFLNSNLSFAIFEECLFQDFSFELTDITSVIIISSQFNKINIADSDLSNIKILCSYIIDLEFNDKYRSKLDEKSFIDKVKLRDKTKNEYEGIYKVYENIANKFKENNLNNNFGEYYYLCKSTERGSLKILPKASSYIYWGTSGYGERISYPLISSLIIVLIFAFLYLVFGMDIEGETISYITSSGVPKGLAQFIAQLNQSLNLSFGMFIGTGVTSSTPALGAYILADLEMIIGVTMIGIGIGTVTRKLVR